MFPFLLFFPQIIHCLLSKSEFLAERREVCTMYLCSNLTVWEIQIHDVIHVVCSRIFLCVELYHHLDKKTRAELYIFSKRVEMSSFRRLTTLKKEL